MTENLRDYTFDLIKRFSGQNRILTIPRTFIELTGSIEAALVLSQVIYWSDRSTMDNGWFAKSYQEWEDELSLSQYQVAKAIKLLKLAGVETKLKKFDGSPTVHYRINPDTFSQWIIKKLDNPESKHLIIHHEETSQSLTESTTESTTKNTTANKSRVVFEAIAKHVFGITTLKGLSKSSAGRIGKLEKIARQLITTRDPAATDELIARRVASFASAETFKAGIQGTTGFELKFAAYLEVTHTMNKPRPEPEPEDDEHLITPEQMAQARELFNQMVKQHDANSPRQ